VAAMARLGAVRPRISAALGPCIAQASYEVGPEFVAAFAAADADWARFFIPSVEEGRSMFDLHGYIAARAARAGVGDFEDSGLDSYADEARFFSYRRATHRREPDYGRLVSAIALD
jgi:polyphenol oxidase